MARRRSRQLDIGPSNDWHSANGDHNNYEHPGTTEVCVDVITNKGGDNPFFHSKTTTNYHKITASKPAVIYPWSGGWGVLFNDRGLSVPMAQHPRQSYNTYAVEGTAKANPSTPHVSLPTFIGEIRDIPRTIKTLGDNRSQRLTLRNASKSAAERNLAIEFGLKPLLSDIKKLFKFRESTERRINELKNLVENGGTSRSRTVDRYTLTGSPNTFWMNGYQVTVDYTQDVSVWVSTRWVPTTDLSKIINDGLPKEINKYVSRLNAGFTGAGAVQTAWELTPWSFLADYFTNIGDFLKATDNSIASRVGAVNVMHKVEGKGIARIVYRSPGNLTDLSPGDRMIVQKHRTPHSVLYPAATNPFLNNKQIGILASLTALRLTK